MQRNWLLKIFLKYNDIQYICDNLSIYNNNEANQAWKHNIPFSMNYSADNSC